MGLKTAGVCAIPSHRIALRSALRWLAALCLGFPTAATTQTAAPDRVPNPACGPPNYCARTDRKVEPYPKIPPSVGPAGSILTDPAFGSRILRATDEKSEPHGGPLQTPSAAQQNTWNASSTSLYVMNRNGGFLLYDFNPSTLAVRPRVTPGLGWQGEPQFSVAQPNLLYGLTAGAQIAQYDISTGKASIVSDPSKCVKLAASDKAFALSVSADDRRFMMVLGPRQDENYLIYVYDRDKGCRWYNSHTGEIGGAWGSRGTVSAPERFGLHSSRISRSGKFALVGPGAGSPEPRKWRIWNVETLNVEVCPAQCAGHQAMGYTHMLNQGGNHPMAIVERTFDHLDSTTPVIPDLRSSPGDWYDSHLSWMNADSTDSSPVCLSTYHPSNPSTPGTPLDVRGPWENEIDCVETDGKGSQIWRFAHTYSTAKNGFWSSPRGNVSPDGRFFMFTSDWEDQLGKLPDGKYRTDVFIVELR
jgi:hypothetical protein